MSFDVLSKTAKDEVNPQTGTSVSSTQRRGARMVIAYPIVLLMLGLVANLFALGVRSALIEVPDSTIIVAATIAALLLLVNHSWIMTSTELTRVRFGLQATPEEWREKGQDPGDASVAGSEALLRCHQLHRNTTENTIYFVMLAGIFLLLSPPSLTAYAWLLLFPVARLGYSHAYLSANTGLRGICMSLSLLALYGMASYLALAMLSSYF